MISALFLPASDFRFAIFGQLKAALNGGGVSSSGNRIFNVSSGVCFRDRFLLLQAVLLYMALDSSINNCFFFIFIFICRGILQ
jgi:hypothetical protein